MRDEYFCAGNVCTIHTRTYNRMNEEKAYIRGYISPFHVLFPLFKKRGKFAFTQRGRHVTQGRFNFAWCSSQQKFARRYGKGVLFCTIKGLSCYLLAVMEVMLLTVLCSHFMRINVAPLCANYHLLSRIKRERIYNSKYHNHSTSVAIHVDAQVRTLYRYNGE